MRGWMFFLFTYTVCLILFSMADMTWGSESTLNQLSQFDIIGQRQFDFGLGDFSAPWPNFAWFGAVAEVLTFDFDIFEGDWNIVRWIVFLPLIGGFVALLIRDFAIPFFQAIRP